MSAKKRSSKAPTKIGVMVVDDHPVVREGLLERLEREEDMTPRGDADTAAKALETARKNRPDVAVVDLSLGEESGLELIQDLQEECPDLKILVLTMHDGPMYAERVLRAGARGFVTKDQGTGKVIEGIRKIVQGEIYMRDDLLQRVVSRLADSGDRLRGEKGSQLTNRELEVLRLTGLGLSTRSIADKLKRSHKTIEAHKANIKEKLKLEDSEELLKYAIQWVRMEDV